MNPQISVKINRVSETTIDSKENDKSTNNPVVNESKNQWWNVFKSFVMVGGDLV